MGALSWLMNLGFAGGGAPPPERPLIVLGVEVYGMRPAAFQRRELEAEAAQVSGRRADALERRE